MSMETRQREGGTWEFWPKSQSERMAAIRVIVHRKQYAKVDGIMIDLFSANAIVAVFDALNEENKGKFSSFPADRMAKIAFKLIK